MAKLTMPLDADQRRALKMLAGVGPRGASEAIMAVHFDVDLLAGLVGEGWASVRVDTARAGGRTVEVVRMKITDAGRRVLAG
jgi:hypothetical protein